MDERHDLLMAVDGMTCDGCVNAVRRIVHRLDPQAEVAVDLEHGRARIVTRADTLEVADALGKGGYPARAMTM
ncbi:heavy-metal-associated domain-containing protein [Salinarimonas chemoclinalis]|uniref:heavy-metal-associated domain-containing protein n=1 Tax=Salinarimonas chemoclinalis TaxID=3241599 RepID=UPI003558A4F8